MVPLIKNSTNQDLIPFHSLAPLSTHLDTTLFCIHMRRSTTQSVYKKLFSISNFGFDNAILDAFKNDFQFF